MADNIQNMIITVDDGFKRIPIQNSYGEEIGVFYFNPADLGIFERYAAMQDEVDAITEPFGELGDTFDVNKFAEASTESRERLYAAVDKMFGRDGAAKELFGRVHPFTPVDGRFYFDRVLEAVGVQINAAFEHESEEFSKHVEKYTNRAQRRAKK